MPSAATRIAVVALLGALSLAFGLWGYSEYLVGARAEQYGRGVLAMTYDTLQLFVLNFAPMGDGGRIPWPLETARFLAPTVTLYAFIEAAHTIFADRWRRWRIRRVKQHAIVVGQTPEALELASTLGVPGRDVVRVDSGTLDELEDAGIRGAQVLYLCAEDNLDSAVNLAVTLTRIGGTRIGTPLKAYAHISDPALATALRARRLGIAASPQLRLDFFNLQELAARELVRRQPMVSGPVVIVGLGRFGRRVLIELALLWRLHPGPDRLAVRLVGPDAARAAGEITGHWRVVRESCDLRCADTLDAEVPTPDRVYLCDEDEQAALRTGLTAASLWRGGTRSVVIRLNRLGRHGTAFHGPGGELLDDLDGRLWLIGVNELACRPAVIQEDLLEHLARAIHEHYVAEQLATGEAMGVRPTMCTWEELAEHYRTASRDQAAHIGAKLRMIGCTLAPSDGDGPPHSLSADELELLATVEHQRWLDERTSAGWRYGPQRDDERRLHPSVVGWDELSESERDKDRNAISRLPDILNDVGLRIVRLGPPN
ncbi:hypothetical protein GCM10023322_06260 [Rugosimonospora acidiphila]|uniref:Ryanodine receptor Ryr domain-containing protein n=1 Tax=Rugosimonospora acidiphila TaxID=556531 RepID=A0ABP9RIY4_9ACTN